MIESKHINSAFKEYISTLSLPKEQAMWAKLNVEIYAKFKQHMLEEYGITIDLNRDLEFFADSIEDDQTATMFKLRYG